ncbi:PRC-barrel domain-containing protein [Salinarimonas sp.]|uniref:PRC-barrel domain-containing protein n=1 Tax=Salinarimonas sp. TaxID=2766526 RepID=UPI0039195582
METGTGRTKHRLIASDRVEGTPVRRSNGETIGTIERVMIDKLSGKVAYAVMGVGSLLGLSHKEFTLPWGVLHFDPDLDAYRLDLTDDQLREAPREGGERTDPSFEREWEEHVHRYYNATPYWGVSDPMSEGR